MKRFEVFHQTSLRRILRIRWYYHVSNEEVLRHAGIKSIETSISAARLRWFGHELIANISINDYIFNLRLDIAMA